MDYGQQNFTLPHDVVPLPSQGIFYKSKKKSIKVGYLTASDENILMGSGKDLTINLLRAKIYEPDIKVEELIEGDVEAILIFLRNTAFGPEMNLNLTDPKDNKAFKTSVMLDQLTIVNGQQPNDDGTFTIMLPKSQSTIKIKPLTYGEIMGISTMAESYPQGRVVPKLLGEWKKKLLRLMGQLIRLLLQSL